MKVVIPERLFGVAALSAELTTLLLAGFAHWGHRALVDDDDPTWAGTFEAWLDGHDREVADSIRLAIEGWLMEEADPARGGWPDSEIHLTDGVSEWTPIGGRPPRLRIDDVLAHLRRPFEIHVEDDQTDRGFLLAIAPPEVRALIESEEARGALHFFNGGGIPNMRRRFIPLRRSLQGKAGLIRRRRMWMMVDSDMREPPGPGGEIKPAKPVKNLLRVARRLLGPAGVWCLERRFVESYLPHSLLEEYARAEELEAVYTAWKGLDTDRQRGFNMKQGLGQDRKHAQWVRFEGWWEGAPPVLDLGFGPHVAEAYCADGLCHADFDPDAQDEARRYLAHLVRRL